MATVQVILQSPAGTQYDVTSKLRSDGLPALDLAIEWDTGEWVAGDIALSFRNADDYFTALWPLPMSAEIVWDEATLTGTWYIQIKKNGALRWHGDIDPSTIDFDAKQRSVSVSVLGAAQRAGRHNAGLVKRSVPSPLYFTCTVGQRKLALKESDGTTPLLVADADVAVGDKIKVTQLTTNGAPVEQELEIKTLGPSVPEGLDAYQVKVKGYPKKAYTSGIISNPWYRGQTVAYVVGKLLDHMGISAGSRDIAGTSTFLIVDEAAFEGKSIADAFADLCLYATAEWFESCGKWYFLSKGASKAGASAKTIDTPGATLLDEKSKKALWDRHYLTVVARGTKERYYRVGQATYNKGDELEISTDFTSALDTLQDIAQAAYDQWAMRRAYCEVVVRDDGTVYQLKDLVTMDGENWWVIQVSEPLRAAASITVAGTETPVREKINLTLLQVTGTAPSAADLDPHDDNTDYDPPYPPTDLELGKGTDDAGSLPAWWADGWNGTGTGFRYLFAAADGWPKIRVVGVQKIDDNSAQLITERLWVVRLKNHPDNPAPDGWELTVYKSGKDPSKPAQPQRGFRDPACDADGYYYLPWYKRISDTATDKECVVQHWDRERGFSCYSDPVATSDADTQTQPGIPTLTLTSAVNDKTGTAKKECDLSISIAFAGCHAVDIEVVEYDGSTVVNRFDDHIALKDATSPITRKYKRVGEKGNVFYARVRGKQETLYTDWSCLDGASAWNHAPPVGAYTVTAGGGTPLVTAPTATPSQGAPTLHVVFAANASGGSGSYTYDWDYGDGSTHGTTATPSHDYAAGTWAAILTVTDSAGQKVTAPAVMILAGLSGMPVPVLTADTTHGAPTLAVTFTRAASGGTAPYAWSVDYGDGTTPASGTGWNGASTALSAHNYTTAGTRTAILTVTDAAGVTAKIELAIFVGVPITPNTFAIAAGAMTSSVVKIPGSTAARCDALCAFTVANCLSAIATISDGTKTHKATAECSGGSGTFYWGPHFKRGLTLTITSVELINGQSRATVSTPANGTCTAGASAAPTPGVVTVGTVETKRRANLYPLTFTGDVTLTWLEVWKGASGATGDPDSNPSAWKAKEPIKLFTRDASGDPTCNMTTAEPRVGHAQDATIDVQFRLENVYGIKGAFVKSSGAAPGTSDDTMPVISSVTPVFTADDIPGTPGKEYDGYITVAWGAVTGAAALRVHVQVDIGSGKKRNKTVEVAGTDTSCEVVFNRKFKRGQAATVKAKVVNGTADSGWSNAASNPYTVGGSATNPAAPSAITITDRKKHKTEGVITWGSDTTLRTIELWKKAHVAADSTTPADSGNTWTYIKRIDIQQLVLSGGLSSPYSFQHKQDEDWDVAARLIDCYGGYAALTGANWATVRTGGSAGDGGNPVNTSAWTFTGTVTLANGYLQFEASSTGRLDTPLHKQKISANGDFMFKDLPVRLGFLDDSAHSGYLLEITNATTGQLYKVDGSGTATAVGSTITFTTLPVAAEVHFQLEVHRTKLVFIIGQKSERFEWTDTSYRTQGWKFWIVKAGSSYARLYALVTDNQGVFYSGLAMANVQAVADADGYLDAGSTQLTIGGTKAKISTFFEKRGSGLYLKGDYIREREPVAAASVPTADLRAGMIQPIYESSGTGDAKYRLAFLIPADFFGAGVPAADYWYHINADNKISASAATSGTAGSAGTGGTCFTGEMELPAPSGVVTIEDVQPGDIIITPNQLTGLDEEDTVISKEAHEAPWHLLLNGFVGVTEEHYLYQWQRGRMPADCLQHTAGEFPLGGLLWSRGAAPVALADKEVVNIPATVYSITTRNKCYWIGSGGLYILAHNMKSLDI